MRAAVLRDTGAGLAIEEVALAPPRAGEVAVRIMATGVCASDLTVIRGKVPVALPLVPGHEAAGMVEAVGPGVRRVRTGDRVALSWAPECGACFYCGHGAPTLCDTYLAAAGRGGLWDGTSRIGDGGTIRHYSCVSSFAELAVVPEAGCVALPDHVSFAVGALVGCAVTTGFGAVANDACTRPGDHVAVVGIGGVGVNAVQAAGVAGAQRVIAVDIDPDREAVARAFGATDFVEAGATDAAERVRALTGGRGVDQAIECSGHPAAMQFAYAVTRPGGAIVIVGIARAGAELVIPATGFPGSRKRMVGSIYGGGVPRRDMATIFELYGAGRLRLDDQIGAYLPLERANEALAWIEAGRPGRVILQPNG